MIKTINFYEFERAFKERRADNFSYEGLRALFDYLENLEEQTGEPLELDVIALCSDFSEYENLNEFGLFYDYQGIEWLKERTIVIPIPGSERFIIQNF